MAWGLRSLNRVYTHHIYHTYLGLFGTNMGFNVFLFDVEIRRMKTAHLQEACMCMHASFATELVLVHLQNGQGSGDLAHRSSWEQEH